MTPRRLAPLAALCAVLTACADLPEVPAAPPPEPPIARTRAVALAKAGTLTATDVPGYRPAKDDEPDEPVLTTELDQCMGRAPAPLAATLSAEYEKGALFLSSAAVRRA